MKKPITPPEIELIPLGRDVIGPEEGEEDELSDNL